MYHIGWYFSDISICQQISPGLANTDFLFTISYRESQQNNVILEQFGELHIVRMGLNCLAYELISRSLLTSIEITCLVNFIAISSLEKGLDENDDANMLQKCSNLPQDK